MKNSKNRLPHQINRLCLTDAGLETWLVFQRGIELREFASFELLNNTEGRDLLESYYSDFMDMAEQAKMGFVAETVTWRANPEWGAKLGYTLPELADINRDAVAMLDNLRKGSPNSANIFLCGNVGPRGDGYVPGKLMSVAEAQDFHSFQIDVLANARTDMVSAFTLTNVPEALGIARAAGEADVPCVISFTLETDGNLPSGQKLKDAITEMDANAFTRPAYYMINCAHPDHFAATLEEAPWMKRIRGIVANASRCSHTELDEADELDSGDPVDLGQALSVIRKRFAHIQVLGGCCGTDIRHMAEIAQAVGSQSFSLGATPKSPGARL